jgi:hypothetical protein
MHVAIMVWTVLAFERRQSLAVRSSPMVVPRVFLEIDKTTQGKRHPLGQLHQPAVERRERGPRVVP